MFRFPAVRGHQMRAVGRTIDGDLAFAAAADCADLLALRGTETLRRALFADRTAHPVSLGRIGSGGRQAARVREGGA